MPYAHRAWSATLAFAFIAGTSGLAHAVIKPVPTAHEPSSQPLAEVIVVGNRSQRMQVPGAADRLERADLEGAHVLSVNEALRKVPGIYARDEEGLGLRPNIGLRGLNPTRSAKILLLEDGLPLAYGPYGDNATYYHPPVERFERIEVLKGSGQILFGPHTVGGVINYITPAPPTTLAGRINLTGGTNAFRQVHAEVGNTLQLLPLGDTGLLLNGTWKHSDGARARTDLEQGDLGLKLVQSLSATQQLTLRLSSLREDSQVSYSGLTLADYRLNPRGNPFSHDRFVLDRQAVSLTHGWRIAPSTTLTTSAYYTAFHRDWWRQSSNSAQRPSDASDPACGGLANLNTTCGNEGRLRDYSTLGLEPRLAWAGTIGSLEVDVQAGARVHRETQDRLQINGDTPTARTPGTSVNAGLREDNSRDVLARSGYVQVALRAGALSVVPGVRYEHIRFSRSNQLNHAYGSTTVSQVIPGLGLLWQTNEQTSWFAGLHRGFSPPRVEDVVTNAGGTVDLGAERSWNSELGVRTQPAPGISLEAAVFRMDFANQIVPASAAGGTGATLTSAGRTLHQGAELLATLDRSNLFGSGWNGWTRLAWTWLDAARYLGVRNSTISGYTATSVSGHRLPYAPRHTGTWSLGIDSPTGFGAQVELAHTGAMYGDDLNTIAITADGQRGRLAGYTVVNFALNQELLQGQLQVHVAAKNLLGREYIADLSRGILPGAPRQLQAGFTFHW
jgi:Fe(3+) dicitrate transport protein